ncbi:hypothetical protein H2203_008909 [Taxawa tesnikishii (nom. ined.)]|nr:hypothetical protein H2203_008909 [Dothideales sp. JES 119]
MHSFTPLPSEQTLYTSPPRTSFTLQTLNKYPGKDPFHLSSSSGTLFLTNRRIIYLPSTPTPQLQSFAAPILNLLDTHVTAPWIGPNVLVAMVRPVQGGGVPPAHPALELKVTFRDGGAYDFQSRFERVKERLQQAVDVARENGVPIGSETGRGRGSGGLEGVDMGNVHLDELPAYEEAASGPPARVTQGEEQVPRQSMEQQTEVEATAQARRVSDQETFSPPAEPPPGYEEVQRASVEDELERRLSQPASGQP